MLGSNNTSVKCRYKPVGLFVNEQSCLGLTICKLTNKL
jgi:hypothetical protein